MERDKNDKWHEYDKIYAFMKLSKENNSTVHLVELNTVLSLVSALADIRALSRFSPHPLHSVTVLSG